MQRARQAALRIWFRTMAVLVLIAGFGFSNSPVVRRLLLDIKLMPLDYAILAVLLSIPFLLRRQRSGWAFIMTIATIILAAVAIGFSAFPNIMVSSLHPAWNLTIRNASSSPYTLTVMSWLALTIVPIVLLYQGWNYWVFKQRIQAHKIGHY